MFDIKDMRIWSKMLQQILDEIFMTLRTTRSIVTKLSKTSKWHSNSIQLQPTKALNTCMSACTIRYNIDNGCSDARGQYFLQLIDVSQSSVWHSRQRRQLSLELRITVKCINLLGTNTSVLRSQWMSRPIWPTWTRRLVTRPCRLPFHQILAHCTPQQPAVRRRRCGHPRMFQCLNCS